MTSTRPNRPGGVFTPASKVGAALARAGYKPFTGRTGMYASYGGYICRWNKEREVTTVVHQPSDDVLRPQSRTAECKRMNDTYALALLKAGFCLRLDDGKLIVWPNPSATAGN